MERTLTALRKKLKGDIYVWLRSEGVAKRFLQDAETEGFTIGGDRPTAHPYAAVMALHDGSISYVGANGNIRFRCGEAADFHRVDYEKYVSNAKNYMLCEEKKPSLAIMVRPFVESDFDALVHLVMDLSLFRSLCDESYLSIVRSAVRKDYLESGGEQYSVIRSSDNAYCGNISLTQGHDGTYELGITLCREMRNQGIGTQALRQFCDYCYRERSIPCLSVRIDPENTRSVHVFEKLGAVYKMKRASPLLKKAYELLGKPLPDDLDETSGVLCYDLRLPLFE